MAAHAVPVRGSSPVCRMDAAQAAVPRADRGIAPVRSVEFQAEPERGPQNIPQLERENRTRSCRKRTPGRRRRAEPKGPCRERTQERARHRDGNFVCNGDDHGAHILRAAHRARVDGRHRAGAVLLGAPPVLQARQGMFARLAAVPFGIERLPRAGRIRETAEANREQF